MSRSELLLGPDAISRSGEMLEIEIRQPWYRSLPLSSVVSADISLNGVAVDPHDVVFSLGGLDYEVSRLREHWQTVWFIQDAAVLRVPLAGEGSSVLVEVALTLRFPYIIIDGVGPLERRTVAEQSFALKGAVR